MFSVIRRPFGDGTNPGNKMIVRNWNPAEDTALPAEQFCGHCRFTEYVDGADHYVCLGHELVDRREASDAAGRPVVKDEPPDDDGAPGLPGRDRVKKEEQVKEDVGDLANYGVLRVPGPEHGVAAGDPAGEVPVATNLEGFDYWEAHPARGAIARVHVEWRRNLYNPANLPEGVTQDALQKVRVTQKEFADGTADVEKDEWGETPRRSDTNVTRKTAGAWRGSTWFFLNGVEPLPGPPATTHCGQEAAAVRDRRMGTDEETPNREPGV